MSVRVPHLASFGLGHRLLRASHIGLGAALARPAKVRPDQPQADVCGPRIRGDGAERANTPPAGSLLLDGAEHASCADRLRTALVDPDSLIVALAMSAIARLTRPDTGKGLAGSAVWADSAGQLFCSARATSSRRDGAGAGARGVRTPSVPSAFVVARGSGEYSIRGSNAGRSGAGIGGGAAVMPGPGGALGSEARLKRCEAPGLAGPPLPCGG